MVIKLVILQYIKEILNTHDLSVLFVIKYIGIISSQVTRHVVPMLVWCCATVYDAGPTSNRRWPSVPCLLDVDHYVVHGGQYASTRWQKENPAAQRQTAVTDHLKRKQLPLFVFARRSVYQYSMAERESCSSKANSSNCWLENWAVTAVCLCTAVSMPVLDGRKIILQLKGKQQ